MNCFAASLLLGSGSPGPVAAWLEHQDELLTVHEVAGRLRVCRATVYKLVERGELACVRVANAIRIPSAALHGSTRSMR